MTTLPTFETLQRDNDDLRARLAVAEAGLQAIRSSGIDALVLPDAQGGQSDRIFTLKGADHAYRVLLENMSEGALTVSAEGVVLFANHRLATMLQTPLESILGSSLETWVAESSRAAVRKLLQVHDSSSRHTEVALRAADGSPVRVYLSATGLVIEGMEGVFGLVATDLTRHREAELQETLAAAELQRRAMLSVIEDQAMAEQSLRHSEQRFRALAEQSMVGIYTLSEGRLAYVNPRMAEIFGYETSELIGHTPEFLIAEEDQSRVRENIRRRIDGEVASLQYEFKGRRKDGSSVMIGVNGSAVWIDGHRSIMGVLQDITDKFKSEQDRRDYVMRIENMITGTVDAMSTMVELRDPYTSGHERRVGLISAAIAAEMGLDEYTQRGLRMAGAVHDVGKLSVPAELLSKPTRLTPLEYELIKVHARAGYDVLKGIDAPWPIAEVAHQHHERIDGSGYPRGLKGDAIILEARILAIADVVESMGSHRPYRPTLGIEQALAEIERGRGTHYDATAVDACLRLFRDKGYRIPA